jgi:hypothetical protein
MAGHFYTHKGEAQITRSWWLGEQVASKACKKAPAPGAGAAASGAGGSAAAAPRKRKREEDEESGIT